MHTIEDYRFHPCELAFCGLSGSGKTTLITRLMAMLSRRHLVGYFKHGCHHFDIDRKGKDSDSARRAGARCVMISDPEKHALVADGKPDDLWARLTLQNMDMLLIEGLKELPVQKIVLIDHKEEITALLRAGKLASVRALVIPEANRVKEYSSFGVPVFHRDSVEEIAGFIEQLFHRQIAARPLFGLVLTGGESRRMGTDKALIRYHETNQLVHTATMLLSHCNQVFISCRPEQQHTYKRFGFPLIVDRYRDIGPLAGVLSAQQLYPASSWMVVSCDLPQLDPQTLQKLASERKPLCHATAFRHPRSAQPEPLCAVYEPKSHSRLLLNHSVGSNSLKAFLQQHHVHYLSVENPEALDNINEPDEREATCLRLAQTREGKRP
ncbi:bifunctional molybdenum cofactor guanylyltransferase MobA/molybdopterin-guanine dinucleotide biosynthesis adaptor protein MobB [Prosthecochloris sp. N3]|uniref:Probable molybdenum cofactor guanylyltransferase n=1 Tax=Prosthecochloris ethylica TaxID=2743976 RepID=A0ABR9XVC8_9CHLB|nr:MULTISPECIES: bifunctional molybdenum cofactor guanylyltransferase MobA/molybdopterin-guanine dinucleotide biosynthesis adaptor protein MobB [Prosthecochloris]MBF0587360.1 bifunctional molybdenum cofactor guanylyltransferase MobA/molybdopterin-guanine dinucleotide biosynthesis adaptor protein MobB [Prosthecochloris ethylica]MBF0637690.1 bifunctional molybdenum cofactor guanylyltransferase MobA/molybdopterin-guanine dinucleotide biosynthesis adaptor protein MobB [Prosthecochloris ethylica]NUK4